MFLTEDRDDGLLYRFLPTAPGQLARGGKLQALALTDPANDALQSGTWAKVRWIDLDDPESPADDLRKRGAALGAMPFARGEGIHLGLDAKGKTELFFVATSGGAAKLGQVWRLRLDGATDRLQLFFESTDPGQFNYGDNLTVAPNGHLIVCEDQYTNHTEKQLRGLTPAGRALVDDADASAQLTTLGLSAFFKTLVSAADIAALFALFGASWTVASPGTYTLPGGLVVKWGTASAISAGGGVTVTFGAAFPTAIFGVLATPIASANNTNVYTVGYRAAAVGSVVITNNSGTSGPVSAFWVAFGN